MYFGVLFNYLDDLDRAIEFANKSLELQNTNYGEGYHEAAINFATLGNVYRKRKQPQKAKHYIEMANEIMLENQDREHTYFQDIYSTTGWLHEEEGQADKALECFEKCLKI